GEPGQSAHVTAPSPGVQVTGRVKPDGPLALVPDRTVNRLTLRGTHDEGVEEEIDLRGGDRSIAEITQQVVAGGGSRAIDLVPQPRKQGLGQGVVARKVPGALFVDDDGDIRSKRSSDIHPGPPRLTKSGEGVPDLLRGQPPAGRQIHPPEPTPVRQHLCEVPFMNPPGGLRGADATGPFV